MEADEANDKMVQQVKCLLAEHPWLSWEDDGSPMFRVEKHVAKDGRGVVTLQPAPATPRGWNFAHPKLSKWTASGWDKDPLIKEWAEDKLLAMDAANQYAGSSTSFGYWSANG